MAIVSRSTTFHGYRRDNGRAGVRNHVIVLPVDDISNAAAEAVANNIKGTLALPHPYGRLQFGEDLELHFRTLIGTGCNPNVAAVVVIGIEEGWTKRVVDGSIERIHALVEDIRSSGVSLDSLQQDVLSIVSVLDVIRSFEAASGRPVPYQVVPRRDGDLAAYWADASLARAELGWTAERDLDQMMRDTWRWQQGHPNGYPRTGS